MIGGLDKAVKDMMGPFKDMNEGLIGILADLNDNIVVLNENVVRLTKAIEAPAPLVYLPHDN